MFNRIHIDYGITSWKVAGRWIAFQKADGGLHIQEAKEGKAPQFIGYQIDSYDLTDEVLIIKATDGSLSMMPLKAT